MEASDLVQLGSAALYGFSGLQLLRDPAQFLNTLAPALSLIEQHTGLSSPAEITAGSSATTYALVGILLLHLAYFYAFGVYVKDEKFKRNSTPGRALLAVSGFYVCKNTSHGTSLLALFSIISAVSSLVLGLLVGFGDGNAVDLEFEQLKQRLQLDGHATAADNQDRKQKQQ